MNINERLLVSFDWLWFLALLSLSAIGLLAIWSTTEGTNLNSYFGRQLAYVCFAVVVFLVVVYFDYHVYCDFINIIYATSLALLGLVLLIGRSIHSNKSWIKMGGFVFQPSEVVKIVAILALAKYYSEIERDHLELGELLTGGLIVGVPMGLVMLQGDLGTAMTFVPIYAAMSFLAGLKRKHVLITAAALLVASPVGWLMLKDHQKGRIQTVFNPESDPKNLGYQTIQSEIAIGSGQFLGKGFKRGSQGQLGFLPARHTDFVFAVWSEERGFVGSVGLLALLLFVALRMLRTARDAKDRLGGMIVVGVLALFIFHVTINVGMVIGLLPIAGIPLPFVSAGGSSLLACYIAMGLCMSVRMRRYVN
jgi:rod shape determining protein RodA